MAAPLVTERLRLRRWHDEDRAPFARLNADPRVTEYLPYPLTRAESDALVDRFEALFDGRGFGPWAVERRDDGAFLGFLGLLLPPPTVPHAAEVEIAWRLGPRAWGRGFATEAARATLADAFGRLGLSGLVSITAETNRRSQRVMQRIGMSEDPDARFEHPALLPGHALRPHVLYRLRR